VANPHKERSD